MWTGKNHGEVKDENQQERNSVVVLFLMEVLRNISGVKTQFLCVILTFVMELF